MKNTHPINREVQYVLMQEKIIKHIESRGFVLNHDDHQFFADLTQETFLNEERAKELLAALWKNRKNDDWCFEMSSTIEDAIK